MVTNYTITPSAGAFRADLASDLAIDRVGKRCRCEAL